MTQTNEPEEDLSALGTVLAYVVFLVAVFLVWLALRYGGMI